MKSKIDKCTVKKIFLDKQIFFRPIIPGGSFLFFIQTTRIHFAFMKNWRTGNGAHKRFEIFSTDDVALKP